MHGTCVIAENPDGRREPEEDLPRVEDDGNMRDLPDGAAGESAVLELDRTQPVDHATGTIPQIRTLESF